MVASGDSVGDRYMAVGSTDSLEGEGTCGEGSSENLGHGSRISTEWREVLRPWGGQHLGRILVQRGA